VTTKARLNKESQTSSLKKVRVRKLTPLEGERLQGFPDHWTAGIPNTERYRTVGNAVTIPVIEFIVKELENV